MNYKQYTKNDQIFIIRESVKRKRSKLYILRLPVVIISSVVLSIIIGLNFKDFSKNLEPFGEIYLSLLQMCIIPIVASSITYSIGKLADSNNASEQIKKTMGMLVLTLIVIASLSTLLSMATTKVIFDIFEVGSMSNRGSFDIKLNLIETNSVEEPLSITSFITNIIPSNIFGSITNEVLIQIVFFSMFMGFSIGSLKKDESKECLKYCETIFTCFQYIITATLYILPFGILCLISSRISSIEESVLYSMLTFIVAIYVVGTIIVIINVIFTKVYVKKSFMSILRELKEPYSIAFSTCNSYASIPYIITNLPYLNVDSNHIKMTAPISITLGRFGTTVYFTLIIMFCAKIYGVDIGFSDIPMVVAMSIIGSIATAGVGGVAVVTIINSITNPFGIESSGLIFLFLAIDPLIDPIRTLLIVNTNINVILLSSAKKNSNK